MEAFTDELFKQKRVEFWGEGIVYWDYRRLELPIERGYPGSNHARQYRFNSLSRTCGSMDQFLYTRS